MVKINILNGVSMSSYGARAILKPEPEVINGAYPWAVILHILSERNWNFKKF